MSKIKTHTLTLATMGLLTAACTSATADNYSEADYELGSYNSRTNLDQDHSSEGKRDTEEATREMAEEARERAIELAEESRRIAEEAMEAAHESMALANKDLQQLELDEDTIKKEIQQKVHLAMIEAQADLEETKQELQNFNLDKLDGDMQDLREDLEEAVKEEHLSKEEMNRILEEVAKDKQEAIMQAQKELEEVRKALVQLQKEIHP